MEKMRLRSIVAATCLFLAACGGGANDNGGTSGSSNAAAGGGNSGAGSGTNSGSGNSAVRTMIYEALPVPSDATSFIEQLNAEGAKGYRFIAAETYSVDGSAVKNVFAKDGSNTYSYEIQSADSSQVGFLAQANQEGAKGFRYDGPLTLGNLYRHQGNSSSAYVYSALAQSASAASFLTQANAQGQNGYWYYGPIQLNSVSTALYMKDNSSASRYAYDTQSFLQNSNDFVSQANSEGAKGYRFKGGMVFGTDIVEVYVKDQTQSSTFTYLAQPTQTTSAAFIEQANAEGGQGEAYLGDLSFGTVVSSYYFMASSCTDFLCSSLNTFTQN